jgi:hypothetical protein
LKKPDFDKYPKIVTFWHDGFVTVIYPPEYKALSQDKIKELVKAYANHSEIAEEVTPELFESEAA